MINNLEEKLKFIEFLDNFKYINRAIVATENENRLENDAEHSWHLAMMALVLHDDYEYLDLKKLLIFAIIHDLPEIHSGDFPIHEVEKRKNKKKIEAKSIEKIVSELDVENSKKFEEWFDEYENLKSKEARFIYQLDKIHPIIMVILSKGKTWRKYGMTKDFVINAKLEKVDDEFGLRELLYHYFEKAEKNKYFYIPN